MVKGKGILVLKSKSLQCGKRRGEGVAGLFAFSICCRTCDGSPATAWHVTMMLLEACKTCGNACEVEVM